MDICNYFNQFVSNTVAASGNQLFFTMEENEIRTGRVFYKISVGGKYRYSILFSNIIDTTYDNGKISHRNLICDEWQIHSAKIGRCKNIPADKELTALNMDDDIIVLDFMELSFDGISTKKVKPGEFFYSDPLELEFDKNEYLCLEISFSGTKIPYHEESVLPVFVKHQDGWEYDKKMPFAGMVGCDRKVKHRIVYFGDSITQGIGPKPNSYLHWNAQLSEKLGDNYSYWNLGIGYARVNDAATDNAWFLKAKHCDTAFVCMGVNDILQGHTAEQVKNDLTFVVETYKRLGKNVILQTLPPFDYQGIIKERWLEINRYLKTELKDTVDFTFDVVPLLGKSGEPWMCLYEGHPNEEGCGIWAEALYIALKENSVL